MFNKIGFYVLFLTLAGLTQIAQADTWQLRVHSIAVDKVSDGEPGDELELFGNISVMNAMGNGQLLTPKKGSTSLWSRAANSTTDLKAGTGLGLPNAYAEYDLTAAQVADGSIMVNFLIQDRDDFSSNDIVMAEARMFKFADGAQNQDITQELGGEKVTVNVSLTRTESQQALKAPKTVMTSKRVDEGVTIIKMEEYIADVSFPRLARQVPKIDPRLRVEIGKDTVGGRYLLLDLSGTTVAAAQGGVLDIDAKTERGFYLEEIDVTFSAPGLNIRQNYPTTTQKSGIETNTTGLSVGGEASLGGLSGGGGVSVSKATAVSYNDFEVSNSGNTPLKHTYKLASVEGSSYRKPEDLLNGISLSLYELPGRAKANFPIDSWVLFQVPTKDRKKRFGTVNVKIDFKMKLRFVDRRAPEFFWHKRSGTYDLSVTYPVDMSVLNDI